MAAWGMGAMWAYSRSGRGLGECVLVNVRAWAGVVRAWAGVVRAG